VRQTRCVSMKVPVEAYRILRREAKAAGLSPGELARHLFFTGLLNARGGAKMVTYHVAGDLALKVNGEDRKPSPKPIDGVRKGTPLGTWSDGTR